MKVWAVLKNFSPPNFGAKRAPRFPKKLDDERGRLILLLAALRLAPSGIGLFVVSKSFFYRSHENSVRHVLPRLGFQFSGCLSIAPGAFRPLTAIGGILLVVQRGSSRKVFVGELSGDEKRSELLATNFTESTDGADLSLGKLVDLDDFREYPQLREENRVSKRPSSVPQRLRSTRSPQNLICQKRRFFPNEQIAFICP